MSAPNPILPSTGSLPRPLFLPSSTISHPVEDDDMHIDANRKTTLVAEKKFPESSRANSSSSKRIKAKKTAYEEKKRFLPEEERVIDVAPDKEARKKARPRPPIFTAEDRETQEEVVRISLPSSSSSGQFAMPEGLQALSMAEPSGSSLRRRDLFAPPVSQDLHGPARAVRASSPLSQPARSRPPLPPLKPPAAWEEKSPLLCAGKMFINGLEFPVRPIGEGVYHKVFDFDSKVPLPIPLSGYPGLTTDFVVLKILNRGKLGSQKEQNKAITMEMEAYRDLCRAGVPVPKLYAEPMSFSDTQNPKNGKFWLVEKMAEQISGEEWAGEIQFEQLSQKSQGILEFAKSWLTKMAVEGRDIINDFRKRNTMLDRNGRPKVVDFSPSETDEDDIEMNLFHYVRDWANGNLNIALKLIEDFPESNRKAIWDRLVPASSLSGD